MESPTTKALEEITMLYQDYLRHKEEHRNALKRLCSRASSLGLGSTSYLAEELFDHHDKTTMQAVVEQVVLSAIDDPSETAQDQALRVIDLFHVEITKEIISRAVNVGSARLLQGLMSRGANLADAA